MNIDIKIPEFGDQNESAVVLDIYVNQGMQVKKEDILFNVETDKVVLEVTAPETGTISQMMIEAGASVTSGQLVMQLSDNRPEPAVTAADAGSVQDDQLLEEHSDVSGDNEAVSADTDPTTEAEPAKDPQTEKIEPERASTDQETVNAEVPEAALVTQSSETQSDFPTTTQFSAWHIALLFVAICAIGLLISAI